MRFSTFVADAVCWVERLKAEPRISEVFLIGHSEGGLVATLAAQRVTTDGVVQIAGAGFPIGDVIRRQLRDNGVEGELLRLAEHALHALERGESVPEPPSSLAALFRPSVQAYLMSWLAIDPREEFAKVKAPALVIQGTTDLQTSVADAQSLACVRPETQMVIIDGMNHILKSTPADREENLRSYSDPGLPLADTLVPAIARFIASPPLSRGRTAPRGATSPGWSG